jgi:hypothetical protein
MDKKQICNYGRARYLDFQGSVSREFYRAVTSLPTACVSQADRRAYLNFLDDWGDCKYYYNIIAMTFSTYIVLLWQWRI